MAGSLLLPPVQRRLAMTPINSTGRIAACIFVILVITGMMGGSPSVTDSGAVFRERQEQLQKKAEQDFLGHQEQFLQELKSLESAGQWADIQAKTGVLLDLQNADVQRYFDKASQELALMAAAAKAAEEETQAAAKLLIEAEFKENRSMIIGELKGFLEQGEYTQAVAVGEKYRAVVDDEFRKLHEIASESKLKEESGAPWIYAHEEDPMSKGTFSVAELASTNFVEFGFPYVGPQKARLALRNSPRHGKDVIFSIERGQLLCRSYDGCDVLVRFDEAEAETFEGSAPADSSTEVVFINDYNRFFDKMRKANRVKISINVFQQGAPVFEFDVSGFNQKKFQQ